MAGQIDGEIIKSAVARKINEDITLDDGATYKIYKEKTVQGLSKPCFFIWQLDVDQRKLMGNTYTRSYMINVRFHANDTVDTLYEYLTDVGDKLLCSLATINVPILVNEDLLENKPVRGTQMNYNIVDDILQFFVTYTIRAKQILDKTPEMRVLNIEEI